MIKAKCTKCGYEWDTNSEMIMVSCPSCGSKVKIRERKTHKKFMEEVKEASSLPAQTKAALGPESQEDNDMYKNDAPMEDSE